MTDARTSGVEGHVAPGFGAIFRSEWHKARTSRSPRRNLILGTVLGIAMSLLLAAVIGATFDDWNATDQADFDPVLFPLSGSLLVVIFFVAASVGLVTSEYGSGMMRLTLTVTPRRWRVLAAKALVAVVATGVGGIVAFAGMIGGAQAIFAANDLPTAELGSWDLWRTAVGLVLTGPLFPVLGVAIAVLVRSSAAAVTAVLALVFAPSMFGGLLPDWWQRNVISLLPGPASDSLAIGHLSESSQHLQELAAVLVVIAWVAGMLLVAQRALATRDA